MEKDKKRIEYLDIIKFISIILVIFCHNPLLKSKSICSNILMLICWSAVPMFFMTTGAIFLNRKFDYIKWRKRIVKTYLVLVVWKIIYLIFFLYIKNMNVWQMSKISIFQYVFLFGSLTGVQDGHMWFISAYLAVILLYPIILLCFNEKSDEYKHYLKTIFVLIIIGTFGMCDFSILLNTMTKVFNKNSISLVGVKNIISLGNYSNSIIFFIIGGILNKYKLSEKYSTKKVVLTSFIGIIVGIIGLIFLRYQMTHTFTWDYVWLSNGYYHISTLILSISLFILIQTIAKKSNKIINIVAQNTLGIFYIHIIIIILIEMFVKTNGIVYNLIKTILTLIISTLICCLLKKVKVVKEIF